MALAKFMGAESVKQYHINLLFDMFSPYLDSFSVLQKRENIDSPLRVSTGSLRLLGEIGKCRDYVEKKKLAKDLRVDERSVERPAKELHEAKLIEKPSLHAGKYCLSIPLRNHFYWYRNIIS